MNVGSLFAGIGGFELGLAQNGHHTSFVCEIEPSAASILRKNFPRADFFEDIRKLKALPVVDIITGGFPCQDLSQAGKTAGVTGKNSGLISEVFRLLKGLKRPLEWLVIENVSFMLQLSKGEAMRVIVNTIEDLGYAWAYRVVDTRAFGLPQRRHRVIFLASQKNNPSEALFSSNSLKVKAEKEFNGTLGCGFYWTEGSRGLGWTVDGLPTLKGGSGLGIPSSPAIWDPRDGRFFTPDINDAERLQGFPVDWTSTPVHLGICKKGHRWKLVGNAVSVPVANWIGRMITNPKGMKLPFSDLCENSPWPLAAFGSKGRRFAVQASIYPEDKACPHLLDFLKFPTKTLSDKAGWGFLNRARSSNLRFVPGFLDSLENFLQRDTLLKEMVA